RSEIYKSTDAGESWRSLGALEGLSITKLAVAPSSASTVYANAWYSDEDRFLDSVHRSTDAGETWTKLLELPTTLSLQDVVVHPDAPDRALVAFSIADTIGGVYWTSDGGITWQVSQLSRKNPLALSLLFDPQRPSRVYTGSVGEIYVSQDAGITWALLGTGLPDAEVVDLEIDPFDPDTIYAATSGGLYSLTYHPRR
ncbi:MAG TPA: hypothetical protein VMW27_06900, partial [Thermoanaerobaculia bacterium]|nr:hypothetical protein [Thermoanaerobaculia bacterium]